MAFFKQFCTGLVLKLHQSTIQLKSRYSDALIIVLSLHIFLSFSGMYYLRTKAAAAAIQFTVDKTKLKASNDAIQEKGKKKKKAIQVTHFKDL